MSPWFYRTVFTRDYNIEFRPPKTDLCNTCELLTAKIKSRESQGKDVAADKEALSEHRRVAAVAQRLLSSAEVDSRQAPPDSQLRTIAIDLQQTLRVPRLHTGVAYYKRKMWLYNFCVYDLNKKKGNMFVWEESRVRRGSNDIASCLMKWFDAELREDNTVKQLRIYCDNCTRQNKNIYMVLMALRLIHARQLLKVEIVFMVPGHSFLPCDRVFGHIERKIRGNRRIYSPTDYFRVIRTAVGDGNNVITMEREDFYDLNSLRAACTLRPAQSVGFAKARQLVLDSQYPEGYIINNTYKFDVETANVDKCVRLMPGRAAYQPRLFNLANVHLHHKYPGVVKLAPQKLQDLHLLFNLSDTRGRAWLEQVFRTQGQNPPQPDDDTDYEDVDDPDDDTLQYVPVMRLPAARTRQ